MPSKFSSCSPLPLPPPLPSATVDNSSAAEMTSREDHCLDTVEKTCVVSGNGKRGDFCVVDLLCAEGQDDGC